MNKIKKFVLLSLITLPILFGYLYNLKLPKGDESKQIIKVYSSDSNHSNDLNNSNDSNHAKDEMSNELPESISHLLDSYNPHSETNDISNKSIRKFPYPYRAMLAICSDIDDATLEEFKTYHKFLNTNEQTMYGKGLGLDIGDSMWLYMANDSKGSTDKYGNGVDKVMTFFKGIDTSQKHNADEIIHFVNCGWIDTLHAFGDFSTETEKGTSFNRKLAVDGWNILKSINFKPTVWINHGNRANTQNFGAYGTSNFMSYQQGDNPNSLYYHTDITLNNGIKYVWNSIADSNFGRDYPLYEISLRDKGRVWGFYRYTSNEINGRIDWVWTPSDLYRQLTQKNLDDLVNNQQYSILAQHLGIGSEDLFADRNINSLKMLKQYNDNGKVLVAKTTRLLNYANVYKYILFNKITDSGKIYININFISDPILGKYIPTVDDLRGITFYSDDPENTLLLINKSKISSSELQTNPKDETGRSSISIKWFKPDNTDYTK